MTSQEFSVASNSIFLFISSSGSRAKVALLSMGNILAERSNAVPKQHSEWIFPALRELFLEKNLKVADLDGIIFDKGPGSFTGVRLAVSLAKTLSFSNRLPLMGLTSLELLLGDTEESCFAAINAFGNKFYVQSSGFDFDHSPEVISLEDMLKVLPGAVQGRVKLVGDGFANLPGIEFDVQSEDHFSKSQTARVFAFNPAKQKDWTYDWKSVHPLYLRRSEAEERLNGKSNSVGSRIR